MVMLITMMITRIQMTMTITGAGDGAQAGKMALTLTDGGQEDCAGQKHHHHHCHHQVWALVDRLAYDSYAL